MWNDLFLDLFRRCVDSYRGGNYDFASYYTEADLQFLRSIGYKPREFFDFVEDLVEEGEPSESTSLLVAAARRDYFHTIQDGTPSENEVTRDDLPTFGEALQEITYLPRILKKARAKLRGELHPDLMYDCGGDRKFLREHGDIHPADFLREVWAARDDDERILEYVRRKQAH